MSPTWIFGWPLTLDYSQQYAQALGMSQKDEQSESQWRWRALSTTIMDLMQRCRIPNTYPRVCWVDGEHMLVFPLVIDDKANTEEEALARGEFWMKDAGAREYSVWAVAAEELGWMLGATEGPKWYRYYDGSWNLVSKDESSDSESDDD